MKISFKTLATSISSMCVVMAAAAPVAHAKSDIQLYSIEELLASEDFQTRLGDFKFTFGSEVLGTPLGIANVKHATNGIGKTDKSACQWAMISALLALKEEAQKLDGIAVEAIMSTATSADYVSATHYQCLTGHTNSRVLLKGTIVGLNE
ncbi:hypothetical protein [Hirschia baltica]|uniref:Excinuclease ATPase subunit n=1 Tax=Hirschia baltica (strain ATCC 49814 / DSM 5838 / IFAM 1418) TaxID=582402 RepID=C6XIQ2_HIRBI|nr:hypothetical protein [Hirschia baltica]ACT58997.1 excinuclease ATPase subunit [Hirschia baltica ATCC 49814]